MSTQTYPVGHWDCKYDTPTGKQYTLAEYTCLFYNTKEENPTPDGKYVIDGVEFSKEVYEKEFAEMDKRLATMEECNWSYTKSENQKWVWNLIFGMFECGIGGAIGYGLMVGAMTGNVPSFTWVCLLIAILIKLSK